MTVVLQIAAMPHEEWGRLLQIYLNAMASCLTAAQAGDTDEAAAARLVNIRHAAYCCKICCRSCHGAFCTSCWACPMESAMQQRHSWPLKPRLKPRRAATPVARHVQLHAVCFDPRQEQLVGEVFKLKMSVVLSFPNYNVALGRRAVPGVSQARIPHLPAFVLPACLSGCCMECM